MDIQSEKENVEDLKKNRLLISFLSALEFNRSEDISRETSEEEEKTKQNYLQHHKLPN